MLRKSVGFALLCLCGSVAVSADFHVCNPWPEELSGSFAIDAEKIKEDVSKVSLAVEGGGAALPVQVEERDGRRLLVSGARIPAYGSIGVNVVKAKEAKSAPLMNIQEGEKALTVETPLYKATFNAKDGYALSSIEDKGRGIIKMTGRVEVVEDGEQAKYNGHYAKDQKAWTHGKSNTKLAGVRCGDAEAEISLTWTLTPGCAVTERICFNAFNRLIGHEVEIDSKDMVIAQGGYALSFYDFSSKAGEGTVHPQMERCPDRMFPAPGYAFAWNPLRKCGMGIVAPEDHGLLNLTWEMKGAKEGVSGDIGKMRLFSKAMRYEGVPGKYRFGFSLMAGGDPVEAGTYRNAANRPRAFLAEPAGGLIAKRIVMPSPALQGRDNEIGLELCPGNDGGSLRAFADSKEIYAGPAVSKLNWRPSASGMCVLRLKRGDVENVYYAPVDKAVSVDGVEIGKLIYKFDQTASASVKLSSHSSRPEKVRLQSVLLSGLDERTVIDDRTLELQPGAKKEVDISWKTGRREYGFTLLAEASIEGNPVASACEHFAVGDSSVKLAQYGVINPGGINTIGNYRRFIDVLKKNYFGAFEYYCWTSCPYLGLTPKGDSWEPETESQVTYSARVEKAFVVDFVKYAHDNGLAVFPWMNGEIALGTGLDHPEYYRYGSNGQPLFYNGTIRNGKRYAIAYSSVLYDENASYEFGRMMSASIDMFGWDGCRFDWAFTPSVVGDPMRAKESEWFNFEGRSSQELFPDPDGAGTSFLKAFRRGVAERHPEFIYGTNSHFTEVSVKSLPKYSAESSRDSFLWYEYLLDYNQKQFNTWDKWVGNLVADIGRSKGNGAQVGVGWMTVYPPGALSNRAMPFALAFSGAHWVGPYDRQSSLGESWKCWRHAMRFSEYYFNREFAALDEARISKEIAVEASGKLMWRNWVSERKGEGRRELVISFLNIDGSRYISERTLPQEARRNLKVSLQLKRGETIKDAFLLLSDPQPHALRLTPEPGGHEIVIPELDLAASLVATIVEKN